MKTELVEISKLNRAEYNPRKITEKAMYDLQTSLEKFGFLDPVIVNKNTERLNIIVGGHQRTTAWKNLGHEKVPVIYVDLNLKEEKELNIRLNKNQGKFDYNLLGEFFEKDSLVEWGFNPEEFPVIDDEINIEEEENEEPVYPIVPVLSEKYDYVIIIAENEIDNAYLQNFFDLERNQSYKNSAVGIGRVVTFDKFKKIVKDERVG